MASSRAYQEWVRSWNAHYYDHDELEALRQKNEEYTARITNYNDRDLALVRDICNPSTLGWMAHGTDARADSNPGDDAYEAWRPAESDMVSDASHPSTPSVFLGTNGLMGLAPPGARTGDTVVQFQDCSAAVIMRTMDYRKPEANRSASSEPLFMLVGRADVADIHILRGSARDEGIAGRRRSSAAFQRHPGDYDQIYLDMELRVLQIISASISTT